MSSTLEDFIMSALHKKVLMILEGLYTPPMNREFHELSSDSETPLSIFFSDDGDAHLIPTIKNIPYSELQHNEAGQPININETLVYSLSNTRNNALFVLAEAIRLDNEHNGRIQNLKDYSADKIKDVFEDVISQSHRFESLTESLYERVHDDNGGDPSMTLKLTITDDFVSIDMQGFDSLRFRTLSGGGRNMRVRNALVFLSYVASKEKNN